MLLALGLWGCVSTELDLASAQPLCVAQSAPEARGSVVMIFRAMGPAFDVCPGVVVGPSLVATAASCLFPYVGEWESPDQSPDCDANSGWHPQEDGSFSSWIGRAYDVDDLSVYAATGGQTPSLAVEKIYATGGTSRCTDDLAIAFVPSGLDASVAAVRLDESTWIGEPMTLAGLESRAGYYVPSEASASVVGLTGTAGELDIPPRALELDSEVCIHGHGGGVFSSATGALVGVIAWGAKKCSEPEGTTVAIRLAPFRRFLLEVAGDTVGDPLRVESQLSNGGLSPCTELGAAPPASGLTNGAPP